ncbi:hypothetical protein PVAP13_3NG258153 [Panicum virgatum]|uniref:Uncharacterized protein n=1 Tax=Panicum virgatum TaxID=38727 RepID=A0A8T0U7P9_PANVG|nr:hypothetical protein PVAP13_3NG258153 [Panicum virgatum]
MYTAHPSLLAHSPQKKMNCGPPGPPPRPASTRRRRAGAPTPQESKMVTSPRRASPSQLRSPGRGWAHSLTRAPDPDLCDGRIAPRIGDQSVVEAPV